MVLIAAFWTQRRMKRRFGAGMTTPTFSLEKRWGEGNGSDSHNRQSSAGKTAGMGKFD